MRVTDDARDVYGRGHNHLYGPGSDQWAAADEHGYHGVGPSEHRSLNAWVECRHCGHRYDGYAGAILSDKWAARKTYFRKHLRKHHDVPFGEAMDAASGLWDRLDVAVRMARWQRDAERLVDHIQAWRDDGEPLTRRRLRPLLNAAEKLGLREAVSPLRRARLAAVDYDGYEDVDAGPLADEGARLATRALVQDGAALGIQRIDTRLDREAEDKGFEPAEVA